MIHPYTFVASLGLCFLLRSQLSLESFHDQQTAKRTNIKCHDKSRMSRPISENEKQGNLGKFEGYPSFSKWMASSEDFLILRRFGELNARAMLLMQDRIARKEELLMKIDEEA